MPLVRINMIKGRSQAEKLAVSQVVHRAMVEHLRIPETDCNHRLAEFEAGDWILPPGKSERYLLIEVCLFAGRTAEAKGAFYAAVAAGLGGLGVSGEDLFILLIEQPRENWGIRGGQRADLVDLGYRVDV
jgi:phenylpyruvate tautomerase PptA (4-oxalocrotonate tautomerase family)